MTASVHRKNLGKQFTCVDDATRFIFHWHRPGEHLPVILEHNGNRFLLTKALVEEARKNQRSKLLKIDTANLPAVVQATLDKGPTEVNAKGTGVFKLYEGATGYELLKAAGLYAVTIGASLWAGIEISKVFA